MEGLRAKQRRKELKLSAQSVADELGTTRVTVSRWEAGISEPDDKTKKALAEVLKTSVSYLMGETDNPEPEKTQINLPINNSVTENENTSGKYLDLGYWGTVAENAKRAAKFGNAQELSLVAALLQSAVDAIKGSNVKITPSFVGVNGNNNKFIDVSMAAH